MDTFLQDLKYGLRSLLAKPGFLVGARATPSLFDSLKVAPIMGRAFTDEDAVPGREKVAVLSDATWKTQFSADPNVIGRDVRLNGETYRVIGVMPASFFFPTRAH